MFRSYLLKQLVDKNIIQYGDFTLKSGEKSNIYINLKNLISYPNLMAGLCTHLSKIIYPKTKNYALCGVPMGGIPLSTTISMITDKPQILLRNDIKAYGTKKRVEGDGNTRDIVLIEDVVTTGTSIKEAIDILYEEGFNVIQVLSIVYRGKSNIPAWLNNYHYQYIFHINELSPQSRVKLICSKSHTINERQINLFNRIEEKETNIVLAYDKPNVDNLFNLLNSLHSHIVGLKVHSEILNLSDDENKKLYEMCKEYNVFLWEDRKFNDIGHTVQHQIKRYEAIRDFISVVPTSGQDVLKVSTTLGKFVLCEMSSDNNLFNSITTNAILSMASENKNNIVGIIAQSEESFTLGMLSFMPGINLKKSTDDLGQIWKNPNALKSKPDMYVIGRGITEISNPEEEIIKYKNILFKKII